MIPFATTAKGHPMRCSFQQNNMKKGNYSERVSPPSLYVLTDDK